MAEKLYDLSIKLGEYQSKDGMKARYKNIGSVFKGPNGKYAILDATMLSMQVNYLANKEQKDSIIAGLFEPREGFKPKAQPTSHATTEFNDEIPF